MLQLLTIAGFVAVFLASSRMLKLSSGEKISTGNWLREQWRDFWVSFRTAGNFSHLKDIEFLRKFMYQLAVFSFIVLAVTGFAPVLLGKHLGGYLLLIHMVEAPFFIVAVTVLTAMIAHRYQLKESEWKYLRLAALLNMGDASGSEAALRAWHKASFWITVILYIPCMLSIGLSMFTIYGTDNQSFMIGLHAVTGLLMTMILMIHLTLNMLNHERKGNLW